MEINRIKLACALADLGWTQKELARRSGITEATVSAVFRRGSGYARTVGRLARALDLGMYDLCSVSNEDAERGKGPLIELAQGYLAGAEGDPDGGEEN